MRNLMRLASSRNRCWSIRSRAEGGHGGSKDVLRACAVAQVPDQVAHRIRHSRSAPNGEASSEAGGNTTPDNTTRGRELVLPPDVGGAEVARAIEDLLRAPRFSSRRRSNDAAPSLQMTSDGRAVVPVAVLVQLGNGAVERGKEVLERVVAEIRTRRVLDRVLARKLNREQRGRS